MNSSIVMFGRNREIGLMKPINRLSLIDHRIGSLVPSWRQTIPFNIHSAVAGVSSMAFDDAENRFLLCGNTRGGVSIVDFESHSNVSPTIETYPKHHVVITTRSKSHHEFMVNGCQWYPVDSSIFATSGRDKLLKIWDATRLTSIEQFVFQQPISNFHWFVSRNHSSSMISIANSSSNVVLLDPRTGNSAQQIRCVQQRIWSVRWLSYSDYLLATGSDSGEIFIWDVRSGKNELKRVKSPGGISAKNGLTIRHKSENPTNKHKERKRPIDISKFHNLAHTNRINCLRCTADGRYLISLTQDRNICVWEMESMRLLHWIKIPEPDGDLSTVPVYFELCDEGHHLWAFVPCANEIVVVKFDASSKMSDNKERSSADHIRFLRGHFQAVLSCAYRRDYNQLISASTDRLVLIWAPNMDEYRFDSSAQQIQQLHEDAYSDDEER